MRKRVIPISVVVAGCLSMGPPASAQGVARFSAHDGVVTVQVDDAPNALDHAIHEVSRACRCVISYEGPEWSYAGDLEQGPNGRGGTVARIRTSSLSVSVSGTVPLNRETAADILRRLIAENERNGFSGRFQLIEGRTLEVRAIRFRARDGVERPANLILDTPISLTRDNLDVSRWLQRIAAELARETGTSVSGIYPPGGPRFLVPIAFEADHEPARQVLDRLLSHLPRPAGWIAAYVPSINSYSLALRFQGVHE